MTAPRARPIELSIVIPIHNQRAYLEAVLTSLTQPGELDFPHEVLVVDDGSTEDLRAVCDAFGARRIRIDPNQGPANARNVGANAAKGETLLFLDADVECPPGFIARAMQILESDPGTSAVSFVNQAYDKRDGIVRNYGAAIEHYWFMGHFEGNEPIAEVLGFTTRNGAVRAAAFRAIGGFDTSYKTNAHEDYDFGKRLAAQFKTVMAQGPLVYHKFPDSLLRLLRNYWVRITLFVPYYIRNRPTLDKTQASPGEAIVRLLGGSVPLWILLAVLPIPGTAWWLGASAAALGAYAASIRGFLRKSAVWSGGWQFPFVAFWIHLLSSQIVTLGGAWGLVSYTLGGSAVAAKSPVK